MQLTNIASAVLLTTLLTGVAVYMTANSGSQEQKNLTLNDCYFLQSFLNLPTQQNPHPEAVITLMNKCYNRGYSFLVAYREYDGTEKQFITDCVVNNDQVILPIHMVEQVWYVYVDSTCKK